MQKTAAGHILGSMRKCRISYIYIHTVIKIIYTICMHSVCIFIYARTWTNCPFACDHQAVLLFQDAHHLFKVIFPGIHGHVTGIFGNTGIYSYNIVCIYIYTMIYIYINIIIYIYIIIYTLISMHYLYEPDNYTSDTTINNRDWTTKHGVQIPSVNHNPLLTPRGWFNGYNNGTINWDTYGGPTTMLLYNHLFMEPHPK